MTDDTKALIERIVRDVAELPDRDSPDDCPEMMLVTGAELARIIGDALDAIRTEIGETTPCSG